MATPRASHRIDFCNFGAGYPKTNNFFYNLLKTRFDLEIVDQPEFLIYTNPETHIHRIHDCVKIYFGIEPRVAFITSTTRRTGTISARDGTSATTR